MRKAVVVPLVLLALMLIGTGTVRASVRPNDATVPLSTAVTTPTSAPSTTTTTLPEGPPEFGHATLTISPTTVAPGESFEARGTCDPPGFQAVVFLDEVFFDITPAATITVSVPAATPPGRYDVTFDCSSTPRDPPYATAGPVTLTVVAAPASPAVPTKLPATT